MHYVYIWFYVYPKTYSLRELIQLFNLKSLFIFVVADFMKKPFFDFFVYRSSCIDKIGQTRDKNDKLLIFNIISNRYAFNS